ncbi:EamA family transporter [candidate division KSB1 bacterium]|nr:EamA family transporter [candidate division KSB1 bacterium]
MKSRLWLIFALVTTTFWGLWGALIELPEKSGFPATLGYSVWALTMIVPALVALRVINWKLDYDRRSILVFPIISLSPVVTILLAYGFLKERANKMGWAGIALAMIAMPLLSYQPPGNSGASGVLWVVLALLVFLAWGIQAYFMKLANATMKAESIFFYMTVTGIILIPFALWMTDFAQPINWGFRGPYLAAMIQILNSIGALCIVYAFRYGRAIIVSPLTNAVAPVITVVISLIIHRAVPSRFVLTGMVLALLATLLMSLEEEAKPAGAATVHPVA